MINMNQQQQDLFSFIANNVSLTILSELIKEKELSIYDLNNSTNSIAQYRYALQKLLTNNIIQLRREKRKCYYSLSPFYKNKIKSLVSFYLSFNRKNVLKILQNFDGWAFTDKSALFFYVPFLPLVSSKYMISVRNVKEKEKMKQIIPEIESLFDIKIQPTYFRTSTDYIRKINGYPVLRPETVFFDLLKSDDYRVRLSTTFLLPFMQPDLFYNQIERDKRVFKTTVYLLFTLHEFLQEESKDKKRFFLKTWLYNIDILINKINFDKFLKIYKKKKESHTFFLSLQKKMKKEENTFTKWDQANDLVPDSLVSFYPKALEELISIEV